MAAQATRALRNPTFRLLWSTLLVGQFGFWLSFIALQALVSRLTDGSGGWLGLLFFVNFVPSLLFTPLAGVVADRVQRLRIMVFGYTAMFVVITLLALLAFTDRATPGSVLPFAFAIGTVFAFIAPGMQSLVANAVPPDDLASAVSLQAVGGNLSRVTGPILATPILAFSSEATAFAIYAVVSAVMVVLLRRLDVTPHVPEPDSDGFVGRLRAGLRHARERPPALAVLGVLGMTSLFAAGYIAFLPVIANDAFDRGPTGFTTLAAVNGLGAVLGALTTGLRQSAPSLRSVAMRAAGFGASLVLFAQLRNWAAALAGIALVGALHFATITTLNTALQYLADEGKRARMMSMFVLGWAGLVPVGALWQGAVTTSHGVRTTLLVAGGVTAAYSLLTATLSSSSTKSAPNAVDGV